MTRLPLFGAALAALFSTAVLAAPLKLVRAEFGVVTNVPGFKFKGKVGSLTGDVTVGAKGSPTAIEVSIPAESITTGLEMRDRHLRERILSDDKGKAHPIQFRSQKVTCAGAKCEAEGTLSFGGKPRPAKFPFSFEGGRAYGKFVLKLSEHGIQAPSHLGIRVKDEVPVDFEVKTP